MNGGASLSDLFEAWVLFRDPILAAVIAGGVLGWLGTWVVLRRMVFVSATISQAAALGVALAFFVQIHLSWSLEPVLGAVGLTAVASVLFIANPTRLGITRESILGLAYVTAGGLAVLIGDLIAQEAHEISGILFGSAVLVRPVDLYLIAGVGAVVLAGQLVAVRGFVLVSFDPDAARVQGLPVKKLELALFLSIGAMVAVSTRALGALPVFAFSILPAMGALAAGLRLKWVLVVATVAGALAGGGGYVMAFLYDLPVGASQVVVAAAFVVVGLCVAWVRRRG